MLQTKWLNGPTVGTRKIGSDFFEKYATLTGREIISSESPRGLVQNLAQVTGNALVDPAVIDFYEQTSEYQIDCWSEWSSIFRPFGRLLALVFSRRLQQLNVPLTGLDTSRGISSRVLGLRDADGDTETAWVRIVQGSKHTLYAGSYTICQAPGHRGACIKVTFPLPNGRAIVIMRPEIHDDGSLSVVSDGRKFGDPGFYLVVQDGLDIWARYVPSMKETIHVYSAGSGVVRADHILRIWGLTFLRLHYRLQRKAQVSSATP